MTDESGIQFSTQWLWDPTSPAQPVNQLLVQSDVPLQTGAPGELVYLTFGQINPPLILGDVNDPEVQALHNGTILPVVPVNRLLASRERVIEFAATLTSWLAQTEEMEGSR